MVIETNDVGIVCIYCESYLNADVHVVIFKAPWHLLLGLYMSGSVLKFLYKLPYSAHDLLR